MQALFGKDVKTKELGPIGRHTLEAPPGSANVWCLFYQNDLDLDPMTLVLKLDLDVVKMYHYAKNKFARAMH